MGAKNMDPKKIDPVKKDRQRAALLASLSIILFALIYWAIQIQDVLETLALATG
jgi:hypothetical protein